jgi:hypothetical protein
MTPFHILSPGLAARLSGSGIFTFLPPINGGLDYRLQINEQIDLKPAARWA